MATLKARTTNVVDSVERKWAVTPWQAKNRSEHQTEWFSVRYTTNPATGRVRATTNTLIELATSLNRRDALGQWQPASPAFQITEGGVEANFGVHRVRLFADINTTGAVQIEKDGVKLQGHPLCIAYYDPVDGRSLMLAELMASVGWLTASNEVVYSNCFDGIRASIRYRNSLDGLEQDLILHERPALTPMELGFSDRTRLELFTEWIGDTPLPEQSGRLLEREKDADLRRLMVEPDFMDTTLTFGPLRMSRGRAFTVGDLSGERTAAQLDSVAVGKRFEVIDGRKILIEAVPFQRARPMLDRLSAAPLSGALTNAALRSRLTTNGTQLAQARPSVPPLLGAADQVSANDKSNSAVVRADNQPEAQKPKPDLDTPIRILPAKRLAQIRTEARIQTAATRSPSPGGEGRGEGGPSSPSSELAFVLDWQAQVPAGPTDYTFSSETNYLCVGTVNLYGTTRIEAGTVIKFAPLPAAAVLKAFGPVICNTEPYRPAFFVSKFDATIGEVLDYANTTPASYYGALQLNAGGQLSHIRVRHANEAVRGWDLDVRHSQFSYCGTVFNHESGYGTGPTRVGNVLFYDVGYGFGGTYYYATVSHLTVEKCWGALLSDPYDRSAASFVNCLGVNVDSMGTVPYTPTSCDFAAIGTVFQTVGAASHYLAPSSPHRGVGSTAIDSTLLTELKQTTTWPPQVLTGTLTANQTLAPSPLVVRNASPNLDRGYAYNVVDYLARGWRVENSTQPVTVLATNGVVVAVEPNASVYGMWFGQNANFISVGSPVGSNRFVMAHSIFENKPSVSALAYDNFATFSGASLGNTPNASLRFTDLPMIAGNHHHVAPDASGAFFSLAVQDTTLRGGILQLVPGNPDQFLTFTNCLFEKVNFNFRPYAAAKLRVINSLFKKGALTIEGAPPDPSSHVGKWRDNFFDGTVITQLGGTTTDNDYNAYLQSATRLSPIPSPLHDQFLSASPAYEAGPFGKYYLPATATALVDQGSVTDAKDARLFHYTTRTTAGSKEGNTRVDIGLHYVGADSSNQPIDTDGDSLADYFEDRNGNGSYQSTDLGNFISPDSDGDGLGDGYEFFTMLTSVGQADTGNTGTSDGYKDSDGDGLTNLEESKLGSNPLQPNVAAPVFSPVGRIYAAAQNVTVTCPTPGAVIHRELSFAEPTELSPVIASGGSILVADPDPQNTIDFVPLRAKAWKPGWIPSETEAQSYFFEPTSPHQPPVVTIAPAGGGTYLASDSIELLVEASASDGPVWALQLYRGNYKVAEMKVEPEAYPPGPSPGPLRYVLNNVPAGTYTYTAKANDWSAAAVTMSAPITITIIDSGPVVSLSGVQPFFTSSPATLLASVRGVNPSALTSLTLNGAPQVPRAGEFMLNAALVEGENTFTLVATDNQNRTGQSTTKVYLDSVAPVVAITAPANNAAFNTTRVNVLGTFTETSLKRITVNGVLAFRNGNTFEARNVPLVTGANVFTATAEDIAGNVTTAAITITGGATLVDPLQLTVSPVGGFAPLSTTFSLVGNYPGTLLNVYYDFEGDASFPGGAVADQTAANLNSINHTYSSAGEYFPVVTIVTSIGRFSSLGGWNASPALRVNVQQSPVVLNGSGISINDPVDLKVGGPSAHLFVLSRSLTVVKEYDSSEAPVLSIALPAGSTPTGLDVDSAGNVYVALSGRHQVAKYKLVSGAYTPDTTFNGTGLIGKANQTSGTGNGEFNTPFDVAVTLDSEEIAVSDSGNHRIQRFTKNGVFIDTFGQTGSAIGQFNNPKGLTYDEKGYLYAADSGNSRIALALSSVVLGISGSSGAALGQFQGMVNLGVGARGIYVADAGNNRVQQFDGLRGGHSAPTPFSSRGALSAQFTPALNQPNAVATVSDFREEKIYIADTGNNRVILTKLPLDNPEAVWAAMKERVSADDINGAIGHFSILSAEEYRQSFTSIGLNDLKPLISQIPAITPVVISTDTAQYRFERVVQGFTITFPIEFVRENGVWRIDSY